MKRELFKISMVFLMGLFRTMSYIPLVKNFGKEMYAYGLFTEANILFYRKRYESAIKAYEKALNYSKGMEDVPSYSYSFEEAYTALGEMYEKGLGVDKDEMKAEEFYLRAGNRGDRAYVHKVAMKSWYEKNWK